MKPYYQDDLVTLYHGNCLEITEWLTADVLVTDPPYGTENGNGYGRHGGNGREGSFYIANDSDTAARDTALSKWGEDRPALVFGSPRMPEPPGRWDERLVWDKREPGLNGGPWRYTHELIFVRGEGWRRVNASSFSVLSFPSGNGTYAKSLHAHAKPVRLMQSLLLAAPYGLIADPFAGSGSTLRAAADLGLRTIGVELEERHCETIAKRLSQQAFDFSDLEADGPRASGWSGAEESLLGDWDGAA